MFWKSLRGIFGHWQTRLRDRHISKKPATGYEVNFLIEGQFLRFYFDGNLRAVSRYFGTKCLPLQHGS